MNLNPPILIPSRGRARLFATDRSTTSKFSQEELSRTYVFVPPEEVESYRATNKIVHANIIPVDSMGMGKIREFMAQWARQNLGVNSAFMFDDDIEFFVRKSELETSLVKATATDIFTMLMCAENELWSEETIGCVGISARQGNNNSGPGFPHQFERNTRIIRAFLFSLDAFLAMKHGRVQYMEDFDVLLQLLKAGWRNKNLTYYAQDQRGTQTDGGCSIHRTHENHEEAARMLQSLHPDVVKLRDKVNKTGGHFGTRKEVTIQWKRALRGV